MRKATLVLLSVSLVSNAFAQGAGSPPAAIAKPAANENSRPNLTTPFTGIMPTVVAQPGQFDIHSADVTELSNKTLDRYANVQDNDRAYVDSVVKEMVDVVNDYQTYITAGPWKQLSDRSFTSGAQQVTMSEFLTTLNEVRAKKLALQTKLDLLTSVSGALPSDVQMVDGKAGNPLPQPRKIDFTETKAAALKNIPAAEAIANNLPFKVINVNPKDPSDVRPPLNIGANSGSALNPTFNAPLYSRKDLEELQRQADAQVTLSQKFLQASVNHAIDLRDLIWAFVDKYGKEEAYRPGLHDQAFLDARANAFKAIVNGFWQRSYSHKVYGVRQGSLLPENYAKSYLGWDRFKAVLDQLSQFKETISPLDIDDAALLRATEDYRQTLIVLDQRTAAIFSGDASVLARINSAITLLRGERPAAEAMLMVVQLLVADLYEESQLANGLGLQEVTRFYEARWLSTEQDRALNAARICAFDVIDNVNSGRQVNGKDLCLTQKPASGMLRQFADMNDELNLQSYGINQAIEFRKQIQLSIMTNGTMDSSKQQKPTGAAGRRG